MSVGSPRGHFRLTDSTNERARKLATAGAPSGTVVTATEQTAGRGRYDRSWEAPAGKALLYSALLRPPESEHQLLSLLVAVGVVEAIEAVAPVNCAIKWPNDVWIEERKVAGILIESRPSSWAVVGIGVNVSIGPDEFPDGLRWPATSVGPDTTVERLLIALNTALSGWLSAAPADVLAAYRPRDALRGRDVEWTRSETGDGVRGRAEGVDDAGNLIVCDQEGRARAASSGEVHLRRGPP